MITLDMKLAKYQCRYMLNIIFFKLNSNDNKSVDRDVIDNTNIDNLNVELN